MVDIKKFLNEEAAPKLEKKVNFEGLLSKVAHIKNGAGTKLSDILGWDYLIRADNGVCYRFYAAQYPLIGMTPPEVTECPLGIQIIDHCDITIDQVIEILSNISKSPFVDIELYWPLTPECKEPYWHIKTKSGSYITIGAYSGEVTPSLPIPKLKPVSK